MYKKRNTEHENGRKKKAKTHRLTSFGFRLMSLEFRLRDLLWPPDRILEETGIGPGICVLDYGCGPGRYAVKFAELVGEEGKVYALDIHHLAVDAVKKKTGKCGIANIEPVLIEGYDSTLPDRVADVVCAIDMFWIIKSPTEFLAELKRIIKDDGILIVDDGHQSRSTTIQKIRDSGHWQIVEDTKDHLKCKPV